MGRPVPWQISKYPSAVHFRELLKAHLGFDRRRGAIIAESAEQRAIDVMRHLVSPTVLNIGRRETYHRPLCESNLSFFRVGISNFGSNIKALHLEFLPEDFHLLLPPHLILPNLQYICVDSNPCPQSGPRLYTEAQIAGTILHFLNAHHKTIQSLELKSGDALNPDFFLQALVHMSALSDSSFRRSWSGPVNLSALAQFLLAHRSHLRRLNLDFFIS
ncbi:hypothetical protein B0H34DRAFT_169064 [Crassisporium funariophilum]|nr:hypothetical protein B0H34DRAFT_169064 [Crassisporium funariophilum]